MEHWALQGKKIVLGVSGGIAAYKAVELLRLFVKAGASVQCIMTEAATRFVAPLTFEALSGRPVPIGVFTSPGESGGIDHIQVAQQADLVVVAPATANSLAKFSGGFASDMLSAVLLATKAPVLLAPGMNVEMWNNPATKHNLEILRSRGMAVVGPEPGDLACGVVGMGRMSEPLHVFDAAVDLVAPNWLDGRKILVTAGPTREALDGVRFLSNRSSGKMGYALARVAAALGAEVRLLSGPTCLPDPWGVQVSRVESAAQMAEAVFSWMDWAEVIVKAAAVADFRPSAPLDGKLDKTEAGANWHLELTANPDILWQLGRRRHGSRPVLVGFAAEMGGDWEARARAKMDRKGCDHIVVNDVSLADRGFEAESNAAVLLSRDGGRREFELMPKEHLAMRLWNVLSREIESRREVDG